MVSKSTTGISSPAIGQELRCLGWAQEAILRMLENTVYNGEFPEELIIYAGSGQAARNWKSYETIVESLKKLESDETLVVQSGKAVAKFQTHPLAPRVLTANTHLVGSHATWEDFFELREKGLISYGQYTAGAWQYIGQQGIVQTTFETFSALAEKEFNGSLAGRLVVSAGLGGMGGAQPLAIKLHGAVAVIAECDEKRIEKRLKSGYLDASYQSLEKAIPFIQECLRSKKGASVAIHENAAILLPQLLASSLKLDVVTDQTSAHDIREGYIPAEVKSVDAARRLRKADSEEYERLAANTLKLHAQAMLRAKDSGAVVFEYGNGLRSQALKFGVSRAFEIDGFVKAYIRPKFAVGKGPVRWVALSGDEADISLIDDEILATFKDNEISNWIKVAAKNIPQQGLPARSSWFNHKQRLEFGLMVNRLVREKRIQAPIAITRDHLDTGSVTQPTRETEGMLDGSDAIADWPILNAMLNISGGAELVALHQGAGSGMGGSISSGVTVIADGTEEASEKLRRVLTTDSGIGVIRHADAGYGEAYRMIENSNLDVISLL